jgi:predicted RNA-binding protein with RPS1 domain
MPKNINKYTNERKEILQKILNILEITDKNNILSLKELDENNKKQKNIIDLEPDIKKYFLCSRWTYFSNKNRQFKRNYLSLIKAIMKDMNIKMVSSTLVKKNSDNTSKCETFYYFEI